MKNFFISILLLTSFSASLFATDEAKVIENQPAKAVLTTETQLELALLYGVLIVAKTAAEDAAGDSTLVAICGARAAAWGAAGGVAGSAVRTAAGGAAGDTVWSAAWSAAWGAAGGAAGSAVRTAAGNAVAPASWIAVIGKITDIDREVRQKTIGLLKELSPKESVELYPKIIEIFKQSFDDPNYNLMLEAVKTFYVVSLARIFPCEIFFRERPEFTAYEAIIRADFFAVREHISKATNILPPTIYDLVAESAFANTLYTEVLWVYMLGELNKL